LHLFVHFSLLNFLTTNIKYLPKKNVIRRGPIIPDILPAFHLFPKRVVVWYNGFKYQINERLLHNVDSRLSGTDPCWRVMKSVHNLDFAMHFLEMSFA